VPYLAVLEYAKRDAPLLEQARRFDRQGAACFYLR
jgi:hypothetical protein